MADQKPDGHATTELRLMISEDKDGMLTVEYDARIKGTEVAIQMRPSHILGQLSGAIQILAQRFYSVPQSEDDSNSNSTRERAKDEKRK